MPLINCEINLILKTSEKCVLTDITTQTVRDANPNADLLVEPRERIDAPTNATFQIAQQCFSSSRNQKKQLLNFHKIL